MGFQSKLSATFSDEKSSVNIVSQTKSNRNKILGNIQRIYDTTVIDPNGKFYITWMSIAAMAVMYNAWVIPLRSTFPCQTVENRPVWMSIDYLADFIYIVDMILIQPRVKFLHEGFWVTDMALLRQNYVKRKHFKVSF